jgi:RNA polymerase sigma factor (sigma-70 family)
MVNMATGRVGAAFRDLGTLIRVGALGHLSDGELLDRFIDRRDGGEAAFECLVSRHGGMVLGVCMRILGSHDAAEDAFQATFLVLVRQAGAIRKKDSLGPWLHGVARRVSLRSRRDALRRKQLEHNGFRVVTNELPDELLTETLRDEIARLPEKYRTPIVLCDIEGQTHAEAARRLDWPIGTVSGRLSRARTLLRTRIAKRGLALSLATLALTLRSEARAGVDRALIRKTVSLVAADLSGRPIRAAIGSLASLVLREKSSVALKTIAGLVATMSIAFGGVFLGQGEAIPKQPIATVPTTSRATHQAIPKAALRQIENERDIVIVSLAPDGITLASGSEDAKVTLWDLRTGLEKITMLGHSAAVRSLAFSRDGRLLVSRADDHTIRVWDVSSGLETLSVTWLEPSEARPQDLGTESSDSGRGGTGRDRCADGPARDADGSGA